MSLYPSLPEDAHLSDVLRRFPRGVKPLLELHDALLRSPSPLSRADRELIAAYVSALNACAFCVGAHAVMARAFGVDPHLVEALVHDLETADLPERSKPLFAFVRKTTLEPHRLTQADADAVYAAGWDEDALSDAVSICALYSYMNRIVHAAGIVPGAEYDSPSEAMLVQRRNSTYLDWGRREGLVEDDV